MQFRQLKIRIRVCLQAYRKTPITSRLQTLRLEKLLLQNPASHLVQCHRRDRLLDLHVFGWRSRLRRLEQVIKARQFIHFEVDELPGLNHRSEEHTSEL